MWWLRMKGGDVFTPGPRKEGAVLGYQSRDRAIVALKVSGMMAKQGLLWDDLELVNERGHTMSEMTAWPVTEGCYALRHREGWYWMNCYTKRVWYKTLQALDRAWTGCEAEAPIRESRKPRTVARSGFMAIRGLASGEVEELPNWFI